MRQFLRWFCIGSNLEYLALSKWGLQSQLAFSKHIFLKHTWTVTPRKVFTSSFKLEKEVFFLRWTKYNFFPSGGDPQVPTHISSKNGLSYVKSCGEFEKRRIGVCLSRKSTFFSKNRFLRKIDLIITYWRRRKSATKISPLDSSYKITSRAIFWAL